jgi:hypothetical protein
MPELHRHVARKDLHHAFLPKDNCLGLSMVRLMLQGDVFANPRVGYLHGMNDVVIPTILVHFRLWTQSEVPLNGGRSVMEN